MFFAYNNGISKELLDKLPPFTIITPHPGEFDRLTHKHQSGYERFTTQIELAKSRQIIVVLKGAYTTIALPNGNVFFNYDKTVDTKKTYEALKLVNNMKV